MSLPDIHYMPGNIGALREQRSPTEAVKHCLEQFNAAGTSAKQRQQLLKQFTVVSGPCWCEPNFFVVHGHYLHLCAGVFINHNVTVIDTTDIYIGKDTFVGPNVVICTETMPGLTKNTEDKNEITIGKHVWIGANVIIGAGTTIGDNAIIGAGSIVQGNVAENALVYGQSAPEVGE